MAKYMFKFEPDNTEEIRKYYKPVTLVFEDSEEAHISEIQSMCRKFALAIGYAEGSVDKYFGEDMTGIEDYDDFGL